MQQNREKIIALGIAMASNTHADVREVKRKAKTVK
jgi:hypothetical protein